MRLRGAASGALVSLVLAAPQAVAQAPAVSGLSPTPTPPVATSGDAQPTPTPPPTLTGIKGPATDKGGQGQSLADVVRISKEARKGQAPKKSLGTITNENVRKGGPAPTPSPACWRRRDRPGAPGWRAATAP